MNWLAHILLSEPTPAFRIGNVLPDLLERQELPALPQPFQRGIQQHFRIDRFTDTHPVVKRSISRISPQYRRFGGILVDLFYDHLLAHRWNSYSAKPLEAFAEEFYEGVDTEKQFIPSSALWRLQGMRSGNLLCSYRTKDGIREALDRIGSRLRRPVELGGAVSELDRHHAELNDDFSEFFPELQSFAEHGLNGGDA